MCYPLSESNYSISSLQVHGSSVYSELKKSSDDKIVKEKENNETIETEPVIEREIMNKDCNGESMNLELLC